MNAPVPDEAGFGFARSIHDTPGCCCAAVSTRWRYCLASAVFSPGAFIGASQGSFALRLWGCPCNVAANRREQCCMHYLMCVQVIRGCLSAHKRVLLMERLGCLDRY